jgi:hypothetical protein
VTYSILLLSATWLAGDPHAHAPCPAAPAAVHGHPAICCPPSCPKLSLCDRLLQVHANLRNILHWRCCDPCLPAVGCPPWCATPPGHGVPSYSPHAPLPEPITKPPKVKDSGNPSK